MSFQWLVRSGVKLAFDWHGRPSMPFLPVRFSLPLEEATSIKALLQVWKVVVQLIIVSAKIFNICSLSRGS